MQNGGKKTPNFRHRRFLISEQLKSRIYEGYISEN